jgi:21S rRNA (GM2251-2'-O)-methyltransferase
MEKEYFDVTLGPQDREEKAINGTQTTYSYKSAGWRHPFILYLDGVVSQFRRSFSPLTTSFFSSMKAT